LKRAERAGQTSGETSREIAVVCSVVIASEAKQSIEQQERKLDCFASLAMTISGPTRDILNCFVRPVGSQ
jgi:hypothetical protein